MMNPLLPDEEGSKVNACVDNIYRIWEKHADTKATQLVFCDLSTPKGAGEFSVYTDIRKKLTERGIPEAEIKFIHEADTRSEETGAFQKGALWRGANPDGQYTEDGLRHQCAKQTDCFPRY